MIREYILYDFNPLRSLEICFRSAYISNAFEKNLHCVWLSEWVFCVTERSSLLIVLLKYAISLLAFCLLDVKWIKLKSAHMIVDCIFLLLIMSIFAFYSCGKMLMIYCDQKKAILLQFMYVCVCVCVCTFKYYRGKPLIF